ncbi:MAG: DUF3987 domain-containing protein [Bacteroidales bacterium]|nr:DUF3987 domain-containing protein [Bacteroidales bacterium]
MSVISLQMRMGGKCLQATQDSFIAIISTKEMADKAAAIASGQLDEETRRRVKESLPAMIVQAHFKDNVRKNENAILNPLAMVDLDHMEEEVDAVWSRIAPRAEELGIVMAYKTISTKGLRLVMRWRQGLTTIEQNQRWLAEQVGLEKYWDSHCTDPARLSFLVPKSYFYTLDPAIFDPEEAVPEWFVHIRDNYGKMAVPAAAIPMAAADSPTDMAEEGVQRDYEGIPLKEIASMLLDLHGGIPGSGARNSTYYKMALQLRYVTDFKPLPILHALPDCGLSREELLGLCTSACGASRGQHLPAQLREVLELLSESNEEEDEEMAALCADIDSIGLSSFTLPPIFRQWCDAAPQDFKEAVTICLLAVLGSLGSRLRAKYLNNKLEAPSFQICLEAPQASGKGQIEEMVRRTLKIMIDKDMEGLAKLHEFDEKMRMAKLSQGRTKAEREELRELMELRPRPVVRYLPATVSITKMLMMMDDAQGCHLFQFSPEIDTLNKAFKRSFSNLSDLLRCAWDGSLYGQQYASETSFSGMVTLRLNTLYCGTPKAVRRFYNDSEDGTMSRTFFFVLPDQFGKRLETFAPFTKAQEALLDSELERLSRVTLVDDEAQEEHVMEMGWLNKRLDQWLEAQRLLSVKTNDRTRGTMYRRAAVEGFRAGELAYYLFKEKNTPYVRKNVSAFAVWVANMMLRGLLNRVRLEEDTDNAFIASVVYNALPDEFDREQLEKALAEYRFSTPSAKIIHIWSKGNLIEKDKNYGATSFKKVPRQPGCPILTQK